MSPTQHHCREKHNWSEPTNESQRRAHVLGPGQGLVQGFNFASNLFKLVPMFIDNGPHLKRPSHVSCDHINEPKINHGLQNWLERVYGELR